ncbi:DUF2931 family protein [Escherichia marmotae]|uniref:DUF2931 family protein n=1 Tax=Escherichia marmotae TaxID=1499973 RepID=UPI001C9A892D|nr:DUF2931 family protein [Escherichia marmotae]MBY7305552.1 DUF2931 family protein [Escherichia marmotae]
MKLMIQLLSFLFLVGCNDTTVQDKIKAPWDKWYFTFSTPKALPATVTLVKLLDVDGYGYVFKTIDQPQGNSVGTWGTHVGIPGATFNKADAPPQIIKFCWDSIIDKKTYETTLFFSSDTKKKMISKEPEWNNPSEFYFFRYMVIGLAPEGKVRVWLKNNGKPNIEQISTKITTTFGEGLDMCKEVTGHPDGYVYYGDTPDFIKGKKYPYGTW